MIGLFKKKKPLVVIDYEKECVRLKAEIDKLKSGSYLSINNVNLEYVLRFNFPLSFFLQDIGAKVVTNSDQGISEKRWYFTEPYSHRSNCLWKSVRIVYTEETNSYKVVFYEDYDVMYESKEYNSYAVLREDVRNLGKIIHLQEDLTNMVQEYYKEKDKKLEKKAWN